MDVRINQDFLDPSCQHEKASRVCLAAQIRSKRGHIEKLDIKRNWSATILLPYNFTISFGGHVASCGIDIIKAVNIHLIIESLKRHANKNRHSCYIVESRIGGDWESWHQL